MDNNEDGTRHIVGGVDTHKDLHVAAVVDGQDRVLGTACFATTRQGYRQMLVWMRSFGDLRRIGIESTGSYGAGLLRFMQQAGIDLLEVTRLTSTIAGDAARMMTSMPRMPPMLHWREGEPSRPEAEMGW